MDSAANEPWFYSREGVQNGPASLAELQKMARAGQLNPRHDLVWHQGMPDWKPAGEIDGLFDRRSPEAAAAPNPGAAVASAPAAATRSASADPYMPPAEEEDLAFARALEWPGMRRRGYIFWLWIFPLILGIVLAIMQGSEVPIDPMVELAIGWVLPTVAAIYATLQRLPNLGMSRGWFFGQLVPILNLWLWYRLFACPAGYAQHKKLDGPGIALAILYWLMIAVSIAFIAIFIAVFSGAIGDPETQKIFREAFEEASATPVPAAE